MQHMSAQYLLKYVILPTKRFHLNVILTQQNDLSQPIACKMCFHLREDLFFGLHRNLGAKAAPHSMKNFPFFFFLEIALSEKTLSA